MPYDVMVRCPSLDRAVRTGIRCDIREFTNLRSNGQFACAICGNNHNWSVEDAWLRDASFEKITRRAAEPNSGAIG